MERKLINKSGIVLILLIVSLSAVLLIYQRAKPQNNLSAVVNVNGEEVMKINLDEIDIPRSYTLQNGIVIKAENHTVRVEGSDCKDKICVSCGELKNNGDIAVCVPYKTVITIIGGSNSAVDVITY